MAYVIIIIIISSLSTNTKYFLSNVSSSNSDFFVYAEFNIEAEYSSFYKVGQILTSIPLFV